MITMTRVPPPPPEDTDVQVNINLKLTFKASELRAHARQCVLGATIAEAAKNAIDEGDDGPDVYEAFEALGL